MNIRDLLTLEASPRFRFAPEMMNSLTLTIGEVARRARVGLDTVRYYERRGLLADPPRTAAGYRQYPPDAARRVTFIKRAQALGFTLEEIAGLLALRVTPRQCCADVERQARSAIERLDGKLAELQEARVALARLADACHLDHANAECPLLEAIEPDADPDRNP
jgi:DNA-binding transcriptional MerR regulator